MCDTKMLVVLLTLAVVVTKQTADFLIKRNDIPNMMPEGLREFLLDENEKLDPTDINPEKMRNIEENLHNFFHGGIFGRYEQEIEDGNYKLTLIDIIAH